METTTMTTTTGTIVLEECPASSSLSSVQATIALWEDHHQSGRHHGRHSRSQEVVEERIDEEPLFLCQTPTVRRPDPPGPLEETDYDSISCHPLLLQWQQTNQDIRHSAPGPQDPPHEGEHDGHRHPHALEGSKPVRVRGVPQEEEEEEFLDEDPTVPVPSWRTGRRKHQQQQQRRQRRRRPRYDFGQRRFCLSCSLLLVMVALILLFVLPLLIRSQTAPLHRNDPSASTAAWKIQDHDRPAFHDELVSRGISSRDDLDRPDSPQSRAVEWLIGSHKDDKQQQQQQQSWWKNIFRPGHEENNPNKGFLSQVLLDRYIMAVLYFSLDGDMWSNDLPFLQEETHVCDWWTHRTTLMDDDGTIGVTECDDEEDAGRTMVPTAISLELDGLSGTIPDEIRHLTHLQKLHIAKNHAMGGNLPSSLRRMVRLQRLSFPGCSIGPAIPDWIGDLTQLTFLDLSKNRLRGSLPSKLSTLTNLTTLRLADNLVDSTLHILQPLTNLQSIEIQNNLFKGGLDDDFISTWSHLVHFNASENQLSGALPVDILGHPTLQEIDLRYNRFTGSIPSQLLSLNTKLQILALDWNELEGPLPTILSDLVTIQLLGVSFNLLTGTISNSIASGRQLQSLFLGHNPFHPGPLPSFLWRMPTLERLHLSNAALTGTLPKSIGFLSTLQDLDVSWNTLTGTLPEEMSRLTNLAWLRMEGNQLSGGAHSICHAREVVIEEEGALLLIHFASDCDDNDRSPALMGDQQELSLTNETEEKLLSSSSSSATLNCSCCNVCCGQRGKLCW